MRQDDKKMNDTEFNIELARKLGWKKITVLDKLWGSHPSLTPKGHTGLWYGMIPNWAGDLNAMKVLEDSLNEDQYEKYVDNLWEVIKVDPFFKERTLRQTISATARQRAEAYLRVITKRRRRIRWDTLKV